MLVGLQSDHDSDECLVEYIDGERAGMALDVPYIECSARLGDNVEAVFDLVLTQIFKKEKAKRDDRRNAKKTLVSRPQIVKGSIVAS